MPPKLINGKLFITKCGYFLVDEHGKEITNSTGDLITFTSALDAEKYLKENNIKGSYK